MFYFFFSRPGAISFGIPRGWASSHHESGSQSGGRGLALIAVTQGHRQEVRGTVSPCSSDYYMSDLIGPGPAIDEQDMPLPLYIAILDVIHRHFNINYTKA